MHNKGIKNECIRTGCNEVAGREDKTTHITLNSR